MDSIQQPVVPFGILNRVEVIDLHKPGIVDDSTRQLVQLVQKREIFFANAYKLYKDRLCRHCLLYTSRCL